MRLAASIERGMAYDRRRYDRHRVQIGAGLYENVRPTLPITLFDLSTRGCGIETTSNLGVDSRVWLKLPGLESWPCRVAWSSGSRAGLSFDQPLHPAVVERFTS